MVLGGAPAANPPLLPEAFPTRWELHWLEPQKAKSETYVTAVTQEGVVIGTTAWREDGRPHATPFVVWPTGGPPLELKAPAGAEVTLALGGHQPEGFVGLARFPNGRVIPLHWSWTGEGPSRLALPKGATGMAEGVGVCSECGASRTALVVGAVSQSGGDPYRAGIPWVWSLPNNEGHPPEGGTEEGQATVGWGDFHTGDLRLFFTVQVAGTRRSALWNVPHMFFAWGRPALFGMPAGATAYFGPTFFGVLPMCSASAITAFDGSMVGWAERADDSTPCGVGMRRAMEVRRGGYDKPFPLPEPAGTIASEASGVADSKWGTAIVGRATGPGGADRAMLWIREEPSPTARGLEWSYRLVDLPPSLTISMASEDELLRARGISRGALIAGDGRNAHGARGFLLVPSTQEMNGPAQTLAASVAGPPQPSSFRPARFEVVPISSTEPGAVFLGSDVDASGNVVGFTESGAGLESRRAAFWSRKRGELRLLPLANGWGPFSEARQFDASGHIVGTARLPSRRRLPVFWPNAETAAQDAVSQMHGTFAEARGLSMRENQSISGEAMDDPADFGIVSRPFCVSWGGGPYLDACPKTGAPWALTKTSPFYTNQTMLGWRYENEKDVYVRADVLLDRERGRVSEWDSVVATAVGYAEIDRTGERAMLWVDRYIGGGSDLNDLLDPEDRARWVLERAFAIGPNGAIAGVGRVDGVKTGFV